MYVFWNSIRLNTYMCLNDCFHSYVKLHILGESLRLTTLPLHPNLPKTNVSSVEGSSKKCENTSDLCTAMKNPSNARSAHTGIIHITKK